MCLPPLCVCVLLNFSSLKTTKSPSLSIHRLSLYINRRCDVFFPDFPPFFSLKIDIHGTQKPIRCLLPSSKNGNESRKMQFSWEAVTFWSPAANLPLPPSPSPAFKYCPICTCLFDCLPPPLPPPQSYHIFIKKKRIPYVSSNGSKDD